MSSFNLTTPVALLVFNRPETTARVFAAVRQARPTHLLLVADGPRAGVEGEAARCAEVRRIAEQVDWPCCVLKNFSETNLGCGARMASGISWVFDQVEEAIILEDDCLPHPSFFRYCQELLEKYRDDERIMHVAGNNALIQSDKGSYSYYFSMFPHCWGWASWRRAWRNYDFEMKLLSEVNAQGWLNGVLPGKDDARFWLENFRKVHGPDKHTWDYQWTFACWLNSGLSILPNKCLISNLGFGAEATHTKDAASPFASVPVAEMEFPLHHPRFVMRDADADARAQRKIFSSNKWAILLLALKNFLRGR